MNYQNESPAPVGAGNGADLEECSAGQLNDPNNNESETRAQAWRLYINERFTGVTVRSDSRYPNMWRIHAGGRVSDMVNLSRARDAAITWARPRGLGGKEAIHWKGSGDMKAAPLMRQNRRAA